MRRPRRRRSWRPRDRASYAPMRPRGTAAASVASYLGRFHGEGDRMKALTYHGARTSASRPCPTRSSSTPTTSSCASRDRDLRLGPAHLPRQDPDDGARRHPRPRVHGHRRGRRPGRDAASSAATASSSRSRSRAASASSASAKLFAACETTNTGRGAIVNKKETRAGAGLFGYSHLYGGYPGRPGRVRARAQGQRRPAGDPRLGADATSRCCSSPTSCRPATRPRSTAAHRQGLDRRDLRRRARSG